MGENQMKGAFKGGESSQTDKFAEENKFWAVEENFHFAFKHFHLSISNTLLELFTLAD